MHFDYNQIRRLVAELTGYRKGTTKAEFRFDQGLLLWKESTRWTRNFVRSLDVEDQKRLIRALQLYRPETWASYYPDREAVEAQTLFRKLWHLRIELEDGAVFECWGKDNAPPQYDYLIEEVSEVCRQFFVVND